MRLKQKVALLLAGVVTIGSVGFMNPVEVRAEAPDSFTITVPANVNITKDGWNSIGTVKVAGTIDTGKQITVSIRTMNGFILKNGTNGVAYTIKKTSEDAAEPTSLDFAAEDVNAPGGASQLIGADVVSFTGKPAGNYTDTITFTAALEDKVTDLTMANASGNTLSTADLGAPSAFTVNGKTYYAYNAFISKTSGSNWQNAQEFVEMLNDNKYDGHTDWMLINDVDKTNNPYRSAIGTAWKEKYSSTECDNVYYLWSSVVYDEDEAFFFFVDMGLCDKRSKDDYYSECGFLVLRGSSNASAPTEVTYTRAGKDALSSANLGTPTSWTYDNTTYQVYNDFIPSSSGSSWNDAMGFINDLNTANYGGHNDWTLLSSQEMATAYRTGAMPSYRGGVDVLWSSVEEEKYENNAYYLGCIYTDWETAPKSSTELVYGFIILRRSSN